MAGPEAKLWQFVEYLKKNFQDITWTRIENSTSLEARQTYWDIIKIIISLRLS